MLNKGKDPPNTEVHVLAGLIKVNKQSFLMERCFALRIDFATAQFTMC
jgi:hypothetical protein